MHAEAFLSLSEFVFEFFEFGLKLLLKNSKSFLLFFLAGLILLLWPSSLLPLNGTSGRGPARPPARSAKTS